MKLVRVLSGAGAAGTSEPGCCGGDAAVGSCCAFVPNAKRASKIGTIAIVRKCGQRITGSIALLALSVALLPLPRRASRRRFALRWPNRPQRLASRISVLEISRPGEQES